MMFVESVVYGGSKSFSIWRTEIPFGLRTAQNSKVYKRLSVIVLINLIALLIPIAFRLSGMLWCASL